jgi:PAS domain S-box-containing protein
VTLAARPVKSSDGLESVTAQLFKLADPGNPASSELVDMPQTRSKAEHAIAKRRRAEKPAPTEGSPEMLAAIIQFSDDAIVSKTPAGLIKTWNKGAERIFGYSAEEAIGQPATILFSPDRMVRELEVLGRVSRGERLEHFETVRIRADGASIDVSVTTSPIVDSDGAIAGISTIARDITARKSAESVQLEHGLRIDFIADVMRAIGARQDLTGAFRVAMRELEEHLAIDFTCICLYHPLKSQLTVAAIGSHSHKVADNIGLRENGSVDIGPVNLARSLRGDFTYEPDLTGVHAPFLQRLASSGVRALVAAPLRVEGETCGILITGRREPQSFSSSECEFLVQLGEHIALATRQAMLNGALLIAYEELRRTQAAVTQKELMRVLAQMANGIAHDINNSLSPAAIYADMLLARDGGLDPEAREYLGAIQGAIGAVAASIARMTGFYRHHEPNLTCAAVDLNRVIEEAVDLTRARWNTKPRDRGVVIRMETVLAPDLPTIFGSEKEVRETFVNLILNAIDAMPTGGTVAIHSWSLNLDKVCIEVTDTGIGMDDATRSRCLEPFFTTKSESGSGLGLALVYGTVERHRGRIEITSELGTGTAIRLEFPVQEIQAANAAGIDGVLAPSQPLRVLLVDDDPILLKSLRLSLERDGHFVVAADGGSHGIAAFDQGIADGQPFDIVITDLGMPYVDGRAVAAAVKLLKNDVPVILLTGWGRRMIEEHDTPPHVNCVLSKPPKTQQLRSALAVLTNKRGLDRLAAPLGR